MLSSSSIGIPSRVHLDLLDLGLVGAERRHRARVGRRLGDDHVAGVDQRLADEVDHLLAAGRDDHLGGVDRRALGRHHLDDALDRRRHPLGRPVLQRARGRLGGDLGHQLRVQLRRERASCRAARRRARSRPGARSAPSSRASPSFSSRACARRTAPRSARARARSAAARRPSPAPLLDRSMCLSPLFAAARRRTSPRRPSGRRTGRLSSWPIADRPAPHGSAPPQRSLHERHLLLHRSRRRPRGRLRAAPVPAGCCSPARSAPPARSASASRTAASTSCRPSWWLLVVAVALVLAYALQLAARARARSSTRARGAHAADPLAASLAGLATRRRRAAVRRHARRARRRLVAGPARRRSLPPRSPSAPSGPVISRARARLPDRAAREALTRLPRRRRARCSPALVALLHPLGYVARRAARVVRCWRGARARRGKVRRPAHPAPLMRAVSSSPPKLVLCVIDAMAPAMLERAVAAGAAPVLARLIAARALRPRLRRRVPVGDARVRRLDRHRRRPGRAPDPGDELVSPRGAPLRRVRLELPRRAALRHRPPADRHGLQHEPRAPLAARRRPCSRRSTTPTCAPPARPT